MPNLLKFERPRPKLKNRDSSQLSLLPTPQPPTQHRPPPNIVREIPPLTTKKVRDVMSLYESVDYDKLTPTNQMRWDAGMYGSIELKTIKGYQYYYLRWQDPSDGRKRSTYLGKSWDNAIAKLKKLTNTAE